MVDGLQPTYWAALVREFMLTPGYFSGNDSGSL